MSYTSLRPSNKKDFQYELYIKTYSCLNNLKKGYGTNKSFCTEGVLYIKWKTWFSVQRGLCPKLTDCVKVKENTSHRSVQTTTQILDQL